MHVHVMSTSTKAEVRVKILRQEIITDKKVRKDFTNTAVQAIYVLSTGFSSIVFHNLKIKDACRNNILLVSKLE